MLRDEDAALDLVGEQARPAAVLRWSTCWPPPPQITSVADHPIGLMAGRQSARVS
jgi:hypothetical protein